MPDRELDRDQLFRVLASQPGLLDLTRLEQLGKDSGQVATNDRTRESRLHDPAASAGIRRAANHLQHTLGSPTATQVPNRIEHVPFDGCQGIRKKRPVVEAA